MHKPKNLLISVIIGLIVAAVAIAFTGPGARTPGSGNPDSWIKSGSDVYYNPAGGGNVGIGTTAPTALLDIRKTSISSTAGVEYGDFLSFTDTGAVSAGNEETYGQYLSVSRSGATTPASQKTYGQYISAISSVGTSGAVETYGTYSAAEGNTFGSSYAYGGYFQASNADRTTALDLLSYANNGTASTELIGVNAYTWNNTPVTAIMKQVGISVDFDGSMDSASTNVYGLEILADNNPGNITNFYGARIGGPINFGQVVTNNYGLYIENRIYGTNKYSIYSAGGQSYFAGNVGIGALSPAAKLHVSGGDILLDDQYSIKWGGGSAKIKGGNPSNKLYFITANSERITIDDIGNVGIGTLTPTYQLQLSTDSAAKPSTNTWTVASDERIKTDIRPFTDGLNTILGINPVWYKYNGLGGFTADGKDNIGVIAQDIKKVAPYTVSSYHDKLNSDDAATTELLNFNSGDLTFTTINAIKELNNKIEALGAENRALKNRVEILEAR